MTVISSQGATSALALTQEKMEQFFRKDEYFVDVTEGFLKTSGANGSDG